MSENLELVTSKNQYLFSLMIKHMEIAFVGALVVALIGVFSGGKDLIQIIYICLSPFFLALFTMIFTVFYVNIKLKFFKSKLPKIIISDDGVFLDEFGEEKIIKWSDVTKVEIKGHFRKVFQLNEVTISSRYEIEYYLFSPVQRRKIFSALLSRGQGNRA